jgi:hypothetical protein
MVTLKPEQHGVLSPPLGAITQALVTVGQACDCPWQYCLSGLARTTVKMMETLGQELPPDHAQALVTYDMNLMDVGRVAALRIRAGRGTMRDAEVLAEAYEKLTRPLAGI